MCLGNVFRMWDTYGEDPFTIRGFVEGGWETLGNADGDLSKEGSLFRLGVNDFQLEIMPNLTENDLIIFPVILCDGKVDFSSVVFSIAKEIKKAKTALIVVGTFENVTMAEDLKSVKEHFHQIVLIDIPKSFILNNTSCLAEFSTKLVLNAITTGACVRKGRVFKNTMINLTVR